MEPIDPRTIEVHRLMNDWKEQGEAAMRDSQDSVFRGDYRAARDLLTRAALAYGQVVVFEQRLKVLNADAS